MFDGDLCRYLASQVSLVDILFFKSPDSAFSAPPFLPIVWRETRRKMKEGVVLFPTTGAGHLVAMIELAKRFRHHSHTLSITVFLIQDPFSSSPATAAPTSLHVKSVASSDLNINFIDLSAVEPPEGAEGLARLLIYIDKLKPLVSEALSSLSSTTTISAFVLDMFCVTMTDVAAELRIPAYVFFTGAAAAVGGVLYRPTLDRMYQQDLKDLKEPIEIPGWPLLPPSALPQPIQSKKYPTYKLLLEAARRYPQLEGILVNTFSELEPQAMEALAKGLCVPDGRTPPVHTVGPLLGLAAAPEKSDHECIKWLDQQPTSSVVFLCFGSLGSFTKEQIGEMARGVELSGHRFLWSVREQPGEVRGGFPRPIDADMDKVLPAGFVERTSERGLVWPTWVPQVAILSHPAVGGFVSHCGWNSTLESVWFGVPLIAWPLYAEQRMNAILLVQSSGLAVELREPGEYESVVKAELLERAIKRLMDDEEGRRVREKMKRMKALARNATEEGGSSYLTLASLVEKWTNIR
ncbi:UDP-glycosyltransferase 88B1-like [Nymphaea colorata]|nr:UDP-glycosyltransferase 88B1-like [Nymphaea colorata]